jgi:hypothetical protein
MARPKKETEIELDLVSVQNESKEAEIDLIDYKEYKIEVINGNRYLKQGDVFTVSGNVARVLLSKNLIKIL